ncbi:hypothetical protein MC885_014857, partial [Smutsia gigantea]
MSGLRRYEVALEAEEDGGDRLQGAGLSGPNGGWSLWGQPRPVRPGSAFPLQDLLGLLLLFPLAALVAEGAELGASSGAEAGASARPDELFVQRPGPCSPALRSQPPPPHTCRHCPASWCIKDLSPKPPCCPPDCRRCRHSSWESLSTPLFPYGRFLRPDSVPLHIQAPAIPKGPSSVSGLQLLSVTALPS